MSQARLADSDRDRLGFAASAPLGLQPPSSRNLGHWRLLETDALYFSPSSVVQLSCSTTTTSSSAPPPPPSPPPSHRPTSTSPPTVVPCRRWQHETCSEARRPQLVLPEAAPKLLSLQLQLTHNHNHAYTSHRARPDLVSTQHAASLPACRNTLIWAVRARRPTLIPRSPTWPITSTTTRSTRSSRYVLLDSVVWTV